MAIRDLTKPGEYYSADYLRISDLDACASFQTLFSLKRMPKKSASDADVMSADKAWGSAYTDTSPVYKVYDRNTTDVSIQDSTNLIISSHAVSELGTTSLASQAVVNTSTVTLVAGHGFVNGVSGQMLVIEGYFMGEVKSVSGNIITLQSPLTYTFPAGTAVLRATEYLNINGSVTPVLFGFRATTGRVFDIEGFHMTFISSNPMDDSLFASLTELTNGMMCRVKKSATQYNHIFNALSNQDLKLTGEIEYSTKAPSGKYGMTFTVRFKDHYGAVVRLDGDLGQQLEIWVRDNLTTLGEIECIIHGHVVED